MRAAGRGDLARKSLEELCSSYWFPLYAFLRRRGSAHPEAEDRVQGFFLHILQRRDLAAVSREKGRFRAWILTALRNFEASQVERSRAQKRGGGALQLSIDWESGFSRFAREPVTERSPEREFERAWALQLIEQALLRVAADYTRRGRRELFEALRDELAPGATSRPRAELAAELDLREGALKVAVHRLRQRFGEALRREVAQTVADEDEVDRELADLMAVLADS
jgi:RNA polymerase sigma-70 factor (ECF subfamily)